MSRPQALPRHAYAHVNNVTYYSYFDTAVNRYLIEAGVLDIHAGEVIGLFEADEPLAAACGHFVHVYVGRDSRRPMPLPAPFWPLCSH